MTNPLIKIEELSFSFKNAEVLTNVSFAIGIGEYLTIMGPNGAGKSTLLKLLCGLLENQEGRISIKDKPIHKYRQRELAKMMAYVPQQFNPRVPYTAFEFVLMGRYSRMNSFLAAGNKDHEAVKRALEITGTSEFSKRALSTLSGGELQRVLIASALVQEPLVLLLDEPTSYLDPLHQEEIHKILVELKRNSQMTIVCVTHDINNGVLFADRIIGLKEGRLCFSGSPHQLMEQKNLGELFEKAFTLVKHPNLDLEMILPEAHG